MQSDPPKRESGLARHPLASRVVPRVIVAIVRHSWRQEQADATSKLVLAVVSASRPLFQVPVQSVRVQWRPRLGLGPEDDRGRDVLPQKLHAPPIETVTQTQRFPRQGAFCAEQERPGDEAAVEMDVRAGDKLWRQGGDGTAARKVGHRAPDRHRADEFRSAAATRLNVGGGGRKAPDRKGAKAAQRGPAKLGLQMSQRDRQTGEEGRQ